MEVVELKEYSSRSLGEVRRLDEGGGDPGLATVDGHVELI